MLKVLTGTKSKGESGNDGDKAYNPYVAGRQEWNERYGSTIQENRVLRIVTGGALLLAVCAIVYALRLAGQATVIPYVIEVDSTGVTRAVGPARQVNFDQARIIDAELEVFVRNWRTVTADSTLQRLFIDKMYSRLSSVDPAVEKMNNYFRTEGNDPFKRAALSTVTIDPPIINAVTNDSYQVTWSETEFDRSGTEIGKKRFQAVVSIKIVEPTSSAAIQRNPLGIFVSDIDYSEINQ